MSLCHYTAGVFPLVSYLHVPGKMSRPLWLSLGTAFLVRPLSSTMYTMTRDLCLVTAAHTLVPWEYMPPKALEALQLPVEYRKRRYVIGQIFVPLRDYNNNSNKSSGMQAVAFPVHMAAVHPTLDVGLLCIGHPPRDIDYNSNKKLQGFHNAADADYFREVTYSNQVLKEFVLSEEELGNSNNNNNIMASCVGYRACGLLGEIDTMDPNAMAQLSPQQQQQLQSEMKRIEYGVHCNDLNYSRSTCRQEAATIGLRLLKRPPAPASPNSNNNNITIPPHTFAIATHGAGYNGMSGAPLLCAHDERKSYGVVVAASARPQELLNSVHVRTPLLKTADESLVLSAAAVEQGAESSSSSHNTNTTSSISTTSRVFVGAVPAPAIAAWFRELFGDDSTNNTTRTKNNSDPVTDDMLEISEEDQHLINAMREEKRNEKNK